MSLKLIVLLTDYKDIKQYGKIFVFTTISPINFYRIEAIAE